MQDVTSGVRHKRYRWSSVGNKENIKTRHRHLGKRRRQKKVLVHVFLKWNQRAFDKFQAQTSKTQFWLRARNSDRSVTERQLVKQITSSFLCSLMIRGHYASRALWFLRPFLYSVMSFSTWGHPRRQSLYEAERLAFEALAPGLSARCCNTWAPMPLIDFQRYY